LYLQPGVPHDGVAVGDCMTYSVGMRAPSSAELIIDLAESVAEPLGEERRYVDGDLAPAPDAHEIDAAALHRVKRSLAPLGLIDDQSLRTWFGCFITRYRTAYEAAPLARPLALSQIKTVLCQARLLRNPWSRLAWARRGTRAELFVAGTRHVVSR